jgi:pimeloyl-ACP methyl ester carboxylesterase
MDTERAARPRILLLPGALDTAAQFHAAGFAEAVRERRLPVDLVVAEFEFRDMTDRSMLERLREGPLADARRTGCANIWLAGVSFGGFLAIAYAERFPGEVAGLCLIAPYLGTRLTSGEIARAGGLAHWAPAADATEDEDRRLWNFLRVAPARRCPVYLGYGRDDRFADSHRLLAAALPDGAVDVVDGGHDWTAWRAVWDRFLDRWPAYERRTAAGSAA